MKFPNELRICSALGFLLAALVAHSGETPVMVSLNSSATSHGGGLTASFYMPAQQAFTSYYATSPGRVKPGSGSPVLALQSDPARPVSVHVLKLPWGQRVAISSSLNGGIFYTLDGSQPTPASRRYQRPFMHPAISLLRVAVFDGGSLVAEAVVFPKVEMLSQGSPGPTPARSASAEREILTEVNRAMSRIIVLPPSRPAGGSSSEVLIEVNRAILRPGGDITILPPLPPTSLTEPEDLRRIISPPQVVNP